MSFVFYSIGIYIQVVYQGIQWGNIAVGFAIDVFGPAIGVIMVVLVGATVLLTLLKFKRVRAINIFLCFFWIISLYQCAINSFLQFNSLPDEPINQFFKMFFPGFWYPVKETVFTLISVILTIAWLRKSRKLEVKKIDVAIIVVLSVFLVMGTLISQLFLINSS
ncbi:MAG: hypothetical protein ACTSVI_15460 [Promethearchaeota archaeon]